MKNFISYWATQISLFGILSIFGFRKYKRVNGYHIRSRIKYGIRLYYHAPGNIKNTLKKGEIT